MAKASDSRAYSHTNSQICAQEGSSSANPGAFRLSTKTLFLTYPQCPIEKEDALQQLQWILPNQITEYVVARENHEDGNHHLHVFLRLDRKCETRNSRFFDLTGEDRTYHGNYQGARSIKAVIKYVTKYQDYLTNMELNLPTNPYLEARKKAASKKASATLNEMLSKKGNLGKRS